LISKKKISFFKGPVDDGKTVDGPRHATMKAIVKGINEVRIRN